MADKLNLWWAVAATVLLLLVTMVMLTIAGDTNRLESDLHRCLRIERDSAALRCVTSVVGEVG